MCGRVIQRDFLRDLWARPHQAHVSAKHIEELRKFVKGILTEESPYGRDPRVVPKFEEEKARELIKIGEDIRTCEEDESPYRRTAEVLRDRRIRTGRVGVEERVRFFLFDGIRQEAPAVRFVSADPVTAGCRMYKSPAEIALLKRSNEIAIVAYKATH